MSDSSAEAEREDEAARRTIAEALDDTLLVEAAAGSGKTSCMVERMVRLIESDRCRIEGLVAVTFTRKAAHQLRERFQQKLEDRLACCSTPSSVARLQHALDHIDHGFVGTIHSFCARLLRERPVEFGVDPTFRELSADEDQQLREAAWNDNLSDLYASNDPLLDRMDELGLDRSKLKSCFHRFIEYRDIEAWPAETPGEEDLDAWSRATQEYVDHLRQLTPQLTGQRRTDELMDHLQKIVRASTRVWTRRNLFQLLELFDTSRRVVLQDWDDRDVARRERDRFAEFRKQTAGPAMQWWRHQRYRFVIEFVRRAASIYQRLKNASGGLDFNDLLLHTAAGLRSQPALRAYFQNRFTHLLVDEFQDTDPIQAEILFYLASDASLASAESEERPWDQCRPRPGSLFLVGDPKQSIYRFRRGDIVTYNRVKRVWESVGGNILTLARNYRCHESIRHWVNRVFAEQFGDQGERRVARRYRNASRTNRREQGRAERHLEAHRASRCRYRWGYRGRGRPHRAIHSTSH